MYQQTCIYCHLARGTVQVYLLYFLQREFPKENMVEQANVQKLNWYLYNLQNAHRRNGAIFLVHSRAGTRRVQNKEGPRFKYPQK